MSTLPDSGKTSTVNTWVSTGVKGITYLVELSEDPDVAQRIRMAEGGVWKSTKEIKPGASRFENAIQPGNFDWRGKYVNGEPTEILTWFGTSTRYWLGATNTAYEALTASRYHYISFNGDDSGYRQKYLYRKKDKINTNKHVIGAAIQTVDEGGGNLVDYLIVVLNSGLYLDEVVTKKVADATNDAIPWTTIGTVSTTARDAAYKISGGDERMLEHRNDWIFNGSGTEAQCLRTFRQTFSPVSGPGAYQHTAYQARFKLTFTGVSSVSQTVYPEQIITDGREENNTSGYYKLSNKTTTRFIGVDYVGPTGETEVFIKQKEVHNLEVENNTPPDPPEGSIPKNYRRVEQYALYIDIGGAETELFNQTWICNWDVVSPPPSDPDGNQVGSYTRTGEITTSPPQGFITYADARAPLVNWCVNLKVDTEINDSGTNTIVKTQSNPDRWTETLDFNLYKRVLHYGECGYLLRDTNTVIAVQSGEKRDEISSNTGTVGPTIWNFYPGQYNPPIPANFNITTGTQGVYNTTLNYTRVISYVCPVTNSQIEFDYDLDAMFVVSRINYKFISGQWKTATKMYRLADFGTFSNAVGAPDTSLDTPFEAYFSLPFGGNSYKPKLGIV